MCADRSVDRLNHLNGLILRASEKRDRMTELLGRRDVSPDMLDALLADVARDLRTVKDLFDDDKWGDDDAIREHKRIAATIAEVAHSARILTPSPARGAPQAKPPQE